jgi:signal transduction histidine kinase
VRSLAATVRGILRTGRTSARVPVPREADDALSELSVLVNAMLDRIDAVVGGMRGALDNVAHDLRTPMARLRGTAEAALASNDPAAAREALVVCLEESEEILAMLNTLMDISEAETGAMALRLEPVALGDLVAQAIDLYEDLAEHNGIRLEAAVSGEVTVEVDRIRIRQALANLVDNAVKYTPAGGEVVVAAGPDGEAGVVLSVTDNGMGIPPDELPHIWSRLYRGDKSRASRGLGLGLSLVKAIVEAHGGQATATSTVGEGSRFDIHLPRRANLSRL